MSNVTVLTQAAKIAEYNPAGAQLLMDLESAEGQPQVLQALADYDQAVELDS